MRNPRSLFSSLLMAVVFFGCSHARVDVEGRERDPREQVRAWCSMGAAPGEVVGSVWMKARSKDASGQFPAKVLARGGNELKLEVTQLMGARAALIQIRGNEFSVETPQQGRVDRKARSWGGIPLEWATFLFMDRLPCPGEDERAKLAWTWVGDDEVAGASEKGEPVWRFKLSRWNAQPWVSEVSWRPAGGGLLELKREDPEQREGWAQRWEVRSPAGEVKVRWKERRTR